jgi:hypothetical protein
MWKSLKVSIMRTKEEATVRSLTGVETEKSERYPKVEQLFCSIGGVYFKGRLAS